MISFSPFQIRLLSGSRRVEMFSIARGGCSGALGYTTVTLLSCPEKARALPLGEKQTPWIQPAVSFRYSPQMVLKGRRSPQALGSGRWSMPLMKLEKTRAWESVDPAARSTELGCQARVVMVLRMGFFKCLEIHQSFSSSK
jgi:hypothetical protein